MTELKLGSLFDGIGGFPLAATMNDIRPVWASEIEPFPMAVTAYRFPQMKHMGDITKLHGANLPVVDVIAEMHLLSLSPLLVGEFANIQSPSKH